jgi:predicted nucleic acid-binding protein
MPIRLELAVDANPLISALLGGLAFPLLFSPLFRFMTTERTTWEVKRYIPMIAERSGVPEAEVLTLFETFPLTAYQSSFYEEHLALATERIGRRDPKDIDILALTYRLEASLWTADPDLRELDDIHTVSTEELRPLVFGEGTSDGE